MRNREKSRERERKAVKASDRSFAELISEARRAAGLSRGALAAKLDVTPSTVGGWERGKFNPRDGEQRTKLADVLKLNLVELSRAIDGRADAGSSTARKVDAMEEFPALLLKLLRQAKRTLKDIRLAAPYTLPPFVQTEFRKAVSARILERSIEVQRVEIFYSLDRLREVLSNILRYDGCRYFVRSYCAGLKEVTPALGGYAFDDTHVILGGYFVALPPHSQPGLLVEGPDVEVFFSRYWDEIWRRGTPLNLGGAADLSKVRTVAQTLGLRDGDWSQFLEEAKALKGGADGAPLRI